MIKNQTIIIPSQLPWDYHCDYIKQTALMLSKKNKVVFFPLFEGTSLFKIIVQNIPLTREVKKNIYHFTPIYPIPLHRLSFIEKINHWLSIIIFKFQFRTQNKKQPILWIFSPELVNFIGKFNSKTKLYDCVDDYSGYDRETTQIRKRQETKIINKVDVVFTNSPVLYKAKKDKHEKVFQIPQGAETTMYLNTPKQKIPMKLKKIPAPRIGFFGGNDYRLKISLIKKAAKTNPNWSFVFLGPIIYQTPPDQKINFKKEIEKLKKLSNVYFLGKVPTKKDLIPYLDNFDIAWIPYDTKYKVVQFCYPMKIFEYFARGKPSMATPMGSLIPLSPLVNIFKDSQEFTTKAKKILNQGWPEEMIEKQKQATLDNSWEAKIEKISKKLQQEFSER